MFLYSVSFVFRDFATLQDTTTGETLCVKDDPIILEKMDFPEPVIKVILYLRCFVFQ